MSWTALVPLKSKGDRKSRLADIMSAPQRAELSQLLFAHVVRVLAEHDAVAGLVVVADERPTGWDGSWFVDQGRGLNAELEAARAAVSSGDLLVLHADLPLLQPGDVGALIAAANLCGVAIAPDRHGAGTNGIALSAGAPELVFRFGADSFRRHHTQVPGAAIVNRIGFGLDLDLPEDLELARAAGWRTAGWVGGA